MTFGGSAYTKSIPGWTLGLDPEERRALVEGWLDADGCERRGRSSRVGTSVSKSLIQGMNLLVVSLGGSCGYSVREEFDGEILGSPCRFMETYRLDVRFDSSRRAHKAEGLVWYAVTSVTDAGVADTYDLEIEGEDHSFLANGIAVHNSDSYDGKGTCRACKGVGMVNVEGTDVPLIEQLCTRCGGLGYDRSKRATYRISLGRPLSDSSGAALQWGPGYRDFHEAVLDDTWRCLSPGGLLLVDIKDHQRRKVWQHVPEWWCQAISRQGFKSLEVETYPVASMRYGANGDARADEAWIIAARKPYESKD